MPSIRRRGDKWQVQIRIKDAPVLAKSFNLKQDAERWAREMEVQAQRGELPADRAAMVSIQSYRLHCKDIMPIETEFSRNR
jgi:hypothetical protein